MDRHDLYELCVQSPPELVPLLVAIHGGSPKILGEDFAGTASISYAWVSQIDGGSALAVDHDEDSLRRHPSHPRVRLIAGDVVDATSQDDVADLIFTGNFSIGYLHERSDLVRYLRHVRARLKDGGVFVCDTYGGESSFVLGDVHRDHYTPEGVRVRYTWEQREADPLTGMVTNALHFRVDRGGVVELELPDAFVYHWRLWSVPELRDAMREAGFEASEIYSKMPDAMDDDDNVYVQPVAGDEIEDNFIVCVVARAQSSKAQSIK